MRVLPPWQFSIVRGQQLGAEAMAILAQQMPHPLIPSDSSWRLNLPVHPFVMVLEGGTCPPPCTSVINCLTTLLKLPTRLVYVVGAPVQLLM
jgi:hypothetical protein